MRKFILYLLIFIGVIIFFLPVHAEEPASSLPGVQSLFFLNQAIDAAIKNNPSLQAEISRTGISRAELSSLKTVANPYFTFSNSIPEGVYSFGLQKIFQFGNPGKYRKNIAVIRRDIDLLNIQKKILEVRQQTREAYIQYFAVQKKLSIYTEIYEKLQNFLEDAKSGKKIVETSRIDILSAETAALELTNTIETLKYEVVKAENHLERVVGVDFAQNTALSLRSELSDSLKTILGENIFEKPEEKISKLTQIALLKRPSILEAYKNIELTQNQYRLALAGRFPLVILEAGAEIDTNRNEDNPSNEVNAFINGNIELPVLDRHIAPIDESLARLEFYREEKKSVEDEIFHEIKNAYTSIIAGKKRIDFYEKNLLPKSEELKNESIKAYKTGRFPLKTFLDAEESYIDIYIAYLDALADYYTAISNLERAVGIEL